MSVSTDEQNSSGSQLNIELAEEDGRGGLLQPRG